MAPVYSRIIPSPEFSSEDELPRSRPASLGPWSGPTTLGNRSILARYNPGDHLSPDPIPEDYLSHLAGPSRPATRYDSRHSHVSDDRRSRSHISISSDDPNSIEAELARLRDQVNRLKTERVLFEKLTEVA